MNKIAVALISGYQQYVSPRKGFSCGDKILYVVVCLGEN